MWFVRIGLGRTCWRQMETINFNPTAEQGMENIGFLYTKSIRFTGDILAFLYAISGKIAIEKR
jgi:hypothetical protein